jgi:hypothetical protein
MRLRSRRRANADGLAEELEAAMPRYHFDLVDHMTVEDKGGQVLSDDVTASDVADRLAEELYMVRPELHGKGFNTAVSGPDGDTVHKAPIVTKTGQRSH